MIRQKRIILLLATAAAVVIICNVILFDREFRLVRNIPTKGNQATWKIIILAYKRSGSSLTGDIIQKHPSVFYVYEPLRTIGRQREGWLKNAMIHYLGKLPIHARLISQEHISSLYKATIQSIFNCKFEQLDNGTLSQDHMRQSNSTVAAFNCLKKKDSPGHEWQNLLKCFESVNSKCQAGKIIAVKCIRLRMKQAEVLLSSDPTVKIIHLIRDPRGVLNSRMRLGDMPQKHLLDNNSQKFCSGVLEDIEVSKSISKRFPNRILTVRYEDIAESPIKASIKLYQFLDLEMNSFIEDYIWSITHSGIWTGCRICTVRNNSIESAYEWRNELDYQRISVIEKSCMDLLSKMGYKLFAPSDSVQNNNISLKYNNYDPDLIKLLI